MLTIGDFNSFGVVLGHPVFFSTISIEDNTTSLKRSHSSLMPLLNVTI